MSLYARSALAGRGPPPFFHYNPKDVFQSTPFGVNREGIAGREGVYRTLRGARRGYGMIPADEA
jgi:hypothetical protein